MGAATVSDRQSIKGSRKRSTGWAIGLCLAIFVAASLLALNQPPRPDCFKPATLGESFLFPYEENAFMRLPKVSGILNRVVAVPGGGHIWVVGEGGLILVSRDKGRSWAQRPFPSTAQPSVLPLLKKKADLNPITWKTQSAHAGEPLLYNQGNQKDQISLDVRQHTPAEKIPQAPIKRQSPPVAPQKTPARNPKLQTAMFVDNIHGWIAGENGTILATTDGGQSWQAPSSGTDATLMAIYFTDREHGWTCGSSGTILATVDGGRRWQAQSSGTGLNLNALFFIDREHGWICGNNGMVLTTIDGGRNWQAQAIDTQVDLHALHFTSLERGWACGNNGTILATTDSGHHWVKQPSGTASGLSSLHFTDREHGWACGDRGKILSTTDGGRSWQEQASGLSPYESLRAVIFLDHLHGWASGAGGRILATTDGGKNWHQQTRGTFVWLTTLHFTGQVHGWVGGEDGMILATTDGGETWKSQTSDVYTPLSALYFTDSKRGWTCGRDSKILSTTDGGQSWQPQASGTDAPLYAIFFIDPLHGWASGLGETILKTIDGGKSWQKQTSSNDTALNSIYFIDQMHGWACGSYGKILSTSDGGNTWIDQVSGTGTSLASIHFTDTAHGWACGNYGTLLSTRDGGKSWQKLDSGTFARLNAIFFADQAWGWACGEDGTILSTQDGGTTWKTLAANGAFTLSAIHFFDHKRGWVCGANGTILSTTNSGQTWTPPRYRRLPAPWYWSLCLGLILVSLFVVQRRGQPQPANVSVADLLASDRPIEAGDPDPLDLNRIAAGIARFIANRSTDPPLTLAVTGEWGTGKSSLMNLLFHDLKMRRFHPVWFNAWHHQKGEQLLASLYAHIRSQAVPPLWYPGGILFRLRLLFRRGQRNRLAFGSLAFLLFAAYPFMEGIAVSLIHALTTLTQALMAGNLSAIRSFSTLVDLIPANPDSWIGALLASPAVAAAIRGIRAFGLSPQRLLALGTADGGKKSGLDPGARARFAQEFQDVSASLDLGAMVIFIDDLDRCTKENVVEILETINFLAVSGRCFIILGMARQWVETCVALQFKELAEETGLEAHRPANGVAHRRHFAQQYLEKLINIEVPVPVPSSDAARALLTSGEPRPATPMASLLATFGRWTKRYTPVVCLATLAVLAWSLWRIIPAVESEKPPAPEERLVLPAASGAGELTLDDGRIRIPLDTLRLPPGGKAGRPLEVVFKGSPQALEEGLVIGTLGRDDRKAELVLRYAPMRDAAQQTTSQKDEEKSSTPGSAEKTSGSRVNFRPGASDKSNTGHALALLVGMGLLVIGGRYLLQQPMRFTSDSKSFRDALAIWYPWIVLVRRTPRTIKRFLNRLRYVAMRLRSETDNLSRWERIRRRIIGRTDESAAERKFESVPEPILVALGAIYHANPTWVKDEQTLRRIFLESNEDLIKRLNTAFALGDKDSATIADTSARLKMAISEYQKAFGQDVASLIRYRDAFLSVLAETGM